MRCGREGEKSDLGGRGEEGRTSQFFSLPAADNTKFPSFFCVCVKEGKKKIKHRSKFPGMFFSHGNLTDFSLKGGRLEWCSR